MSYNKRIRWKDHSVERPRTYTETVNEDGSKTLTPAPGEILQQGTPLSASNFNRMEEGLQHINVAFDLFTTAFQAELRGREAMEGSLVPFTAEEVLEIWNDEEN